MTDTINIDFTNSEMRTLCTLDDWIETYVTTRGQVRRAAAAQIREIARAFPRLADRIPHAVWLAIYRVRAEGTVPP